MTYEYDCPTCGEEVVRCCTVCERHKQKCKCGAWLVKRYLPSGVKILIPERFHTNWEDITNPDDKKLNHYGADVNENTVATY